MLGLQQGPGDKEKPNMKDENKIRDTQNKGGILQ